MGIANYTNLSERLNVVLKSGQSVSITEMVCTAAGSMVILASEGEPADQSDLENGFINIIDVLYHDGRIKPLPTNENEERILQSYESGKLAAQGYGGRDGDQFLDIRWVAASEDLPVIVNINL